MHEPWGGMPIITVTMMVIIMISKVGLWARSPIMPLSLVLWPWWESPSNNYCYYNIITITNNNNIIITINNITISIINYNNITTTITIICVYDQDRLVPASASPFLSRLRRQTEMVHNDDDLRLFSLSDWLIITDYRSCSPKPSQSWKSGADKCWPSSGLWGGSP